MCKYSDDAGYECPHDKLEDSDYCIFHLQDDNKDVDEFNKGMKEILESEEDSISLHGFYFPPKSSDFSAKQFQKKMCFHGAVFAGDANFEHTIFSGYADFMGATFLGRASFGSPIFKKEKTKFSGDANFERATFSKLASFMGAEFSGDAHFEHTIFLKSATFSDVDFSKDVHFEHADFSKFANSIDADFSERTDIGYVKLPEANFTGATFTGNVYFMYAAFSERADFGKSDIKKRQTTFSKGAHFIETTFMGKTNFEEAIFTRAAFFVETTFRGKTNFRKTTFSKSVCFNDAEFTGKFEFLPDKCEIISFENTYFSDNVRIKADLSKCSFVNSNVERVDMTDSIWIINNEHKNSYKIWEERQGELTSNWKELEGIYRRLKQSYQRFGANGTAGNFYYHEMECKRQQSRGFKNLRDWVYKVSCGYGERPWNVFWISASIILASSLSFFYWGIELLGSEVLNFPPRLINYDLSLNFQWVITNFDMVFRDWLECLYTSVITFTTLGYGDVHPIGFSRIVASVEAGIGIIMTALFIFVFTRKMLR